MVMSPEDQLERYTFGFIRTWAFNKLLLLAHKTVGLYTGNQSMKTCSVAYQYVLRILSDHPIPKRNVLYLECSTRSIYDMAPHGYNAVVDKLTGEKHRGWERGTWCYDNVPADGICPICGADIVIHKRDSRVFRFCGERLPTEKGDTGYGGQSSEIKNAVYPEFKKWLPDFLIKRDGSGRKLDITIRNPAMTITDIRSGLVFFKGTPREQQYVGGDLIVEFMSFNQADQAGAGVQRISIWIDEHSPFSFYEEQIPRLLGEDGDLILTLTPALGVSWEYDDIFEKSSVYIRTQAICDFLSNDRRKFARVEVVDPEGDIAVIQAATDDNPTLSPEVIEKTYANMADPDGTVVPTRRYGIFKAAAGKIFKDFTYRVHVINPRKYELDLSVIRGWTLGIGEDFHPRTPHAILWAAVSPGDEVFVYREWNPSPEKWVTRDLCERIADLSVMEKFKLCLIDPLANTPNPDTAKTTIQEMNKNFYRLKNTVDGFEGMYFKPWKSQGQEGRDAVKDRLANSLRVGKPFNNMVVEDGLKKRLPTIWFCIDPKESDVFNCRESVRALKHWAWETWKDSRHLVTKDQKQVPGERWSHFCTVLEGLLKDKRFRAHRDRRPRDRGAPMYFQGRN